MLFASAAALLALRLVPLAHASAPDSHRHLRRAVPPPAASAPVNLSNATLNVTATNSSDLSVNATVAGTGAPNTPQCGTHCMTVKLGEAPSWFGQGELAYYCSREEFLKAYDQCVNDHCKGDELQLAVDAGKAACAQYASNGNHSASTGTAAGHNNPADATSAHGPTSSASPTSTTSGATLNNTLVGPTNSSGTSNRFSNGVSSAASQAANSSASSLTCSSILIGLSSILVVATL